MSSSMVAADTTPLILTWNEAPNIGRTLARLRWAPRIVVIDSHSTDETESICRSFANVDFMQRQFDTLAGQCNFGIDQIRSGWVLSLDADYVLSEALEAELQSLAPADQLAGYEARFTYAIAGRPLRASLYPPRVVLFRRDRGQYEQDGHAHRLRLDGAAAHLAGAIVHDDRKSLAHWLSAQDRYAAMEVEKLLAARPGALPLIDRLRRMTWPAPFAVFLYTLCAKGLILEGWPGWYYVLQRTVAEMVLSLRLLEARWNGRP
jgi:glycosyltransferase involved in cell wall biosynthesis